jgi:hypothetical protein
VKFVMVQFPDTVDTSSLIIDAPVTVGIVAGGIIIINGNMQNPSAEVLIPHVHDVPSGMSSVSIPTSRTGPPMA